MIYRIKQLFLFLLLLGNTLPSFSQEMLTLRKALELGVTNYGTIRAKTFQVESAEQGVALSKREYLPNLVLSAQQVYGTINGQNGPAFGFGGYGVASSGLPLPEQNWNAAFGSLYLANVNWEVFSFGRAAGKINVSRAVSNVATADLEQEKFQHQVRIAAAYLNVLACQRLTAAQKKNLERAQIFQRSVSARAKGGLVAGVDSALANAEVANARIAFLRAQDLQQEERKKLTVLIGVVQDFTIDSIFVIASPRVDVQPQTTVLHPVLSFYQRRIEQNDAQVKLSRRSYFPSLNLVGVFQARASGFEAEYVQDQTAFSRSYTDGISPTRMNYLVGAALTWNLSSVFRTDAQVKMFHYQGQAAKAEHDLVVQQLSTQRDIADTKLAIAWQIQQQAPIQVQSATNAYLQKSALYRNGLTNLVDVTQTLYTLNRAETDRDIAFINLWQALLLKAAAAGDLTLFTNELNRQ